MFHPVDRGSWRECNWAHGHADRDRWNAVRLKAPKIEDVVTVRSCTMYFYLPDGLPGADPGCVRAKVALADSDIRLGENRGDNPDGGG